MTNSLPPKSLVLYADDDHDDIELVKEAFEGYSQSIEFVSFESGHELIQYMERLDPLDPLPCLIILDINMPAMDGKEVLRRLRSMDGFVEVPIVLFSTSTLPAEVAFAKSFNAGFVTKPLHSQQIHQLVDRMVEHCTDDVKENFKKMRNS